MGTSSQQHAIAFIAEQRSIQKGKDKRQRQALASGSEIGKGQEMEKKEKHSQLAIQRGKKKGIKGGRRVIDGEDIPRMFEHNTWGKSKTISMGGNSVGGNNMKEKKKREKENVEESEVRSQKKSKY